VNFQRRAQERTLDRGFVIGEALQRAFELAHFLHEDRAIALRIVGSAVNKLEVATSAQKKRLYYAPIGRKLSFGAKTEFFRSKIRFSASHLLQRLIYIESEPYEKQRESAQGVVALREEDLLIHFIKHLVRITLKRNSFYVALGLSRFLHNYSTAEAMEIYAIVVQDPERVKDDYYYRSRKALLLRELKERFGTLLHTSRGPRGEERLRQQEPSERHAELVNECLSLFMPWGTLCAVPTNFNPMLDEIPRLSGAGPQGEDDAELNRLHSILHPICFQRLAEALKFDSPGTRLAVPQFLLSGQNNDQGKPRGDRHRPQLSEEEMAALKSQMEEQASRRKKTPVQLLRIFVDGTERAQLNLKREQQVHLSLAEDAELVEVRGFDEESSGGGLLLASHLLNHACVRGALPSATAIVLEGGQQISISISPSLDAAGELESSTVRISFSERNFNRALVLLFHRLQHKLAVTLVWGGLRESPVFWSILIFTVLAIAGALYSRKQSSLPATPQITQQQQVSTPTSIKDTSPLAERQNDSAPPLRRKDVSPAAPPKIRSQAANTGAVSKSEQTRIARATNSNNIRANGEERAVTEPELTRGTRTEVGAASLLSVRKIYLEFLGEAPTSLELQPLLAGRLEASGKFTIISNGDAADAYLKVTFQKLSDDTPRKSYPVNNNEVSLPADPTNIRAEQVSVIVQLVNARGEVLWPITPRDGAAQYSGSAARVATAIVCNLLSTIRKLERQQ
jgi:hypothetical protein